MTNPARRTLADVRKTNDIVNRCREYFSELFFPTEKSQKEQGFEPNSYIRLLRFVAHLFIRLLRLNGSNRFSNEFIQLLDPKLDVPLPHGESLTFRTGHGRLLWRARTFLQEERGLIEWIDTFDTSSDCFYDIGSNVGSYALYAAKRGVETIACEVEFNNFQLLCENIMLNRLEQRCVPVPLGLGDKTELGTLFMKSVSKGDALHGVGKPSYLLNTAKFNPIELKVLCVSLDDLVMKFGFPQPTRVKIDVDGNELLVVKGAAKTLSLIHELYIEVDPKYPAHQELLGFLERAGFMIAAREDTPTRWNSEICNMLFRRR